MDSKKSESINSVTRSAGIMGIATLMSRVLGLVREQVFAYFFGASFQTDAFQIAFRIPNLLRDLFAEGALSSALVPTFLKVRESEGQRRGWQVAGRVFIFLTSIVALIAAVGILFSDELVRIYAPGFIRIPEKFALTVRMTQVMFPFFPLVALAAAFMAILNALGFFFIPGFSSALFNLTSIIVGVSLSEWIRSYGAIGSFSDPIEGMAIGVVAGGFVQAFCQWPLLKKSGFSFQKKQNEDFSITHDPALRRMMLVMVPGAFGLAATQINILVNSVIATSQGTGSVSWLNYAFRLMQFPIGVFGVSLATANLSVFSKLWAKNQKPDALATLESTLKKTIAVNLPASVGLAVLGLPIISLIFEHGRFTALDTESTARLLGAYSIGLLGYSLVKVWVPVFYALGNTVVPVVSSGLSVALNAGLNLFLVKKIGLIGLPLGVSVVALFNALFLFMAARKELLRHDLVFSLSSIVRAFVLHGFISAIVGGIAWTVAWEIQEFRLESSLFFFRLIQVILSMAAAGAVWWGLGVVFRVPEILSTIEIFRRKLKRKR